MTPAQRKAAERARKREAGLIRFEAWIRPEDRARVQRYVERLGRTDRKNLSNAPNR